MDSLNRDSHASPPQRAAGYLLGARQDQMLTLDKWTDLARAVAACQERKTADYLTEHDLEDIAERLVPSSTSGQQLLH